MQKIQECQRVRSEVVALGVLHNNLIALSTRSHGIRIFTLNGCKNRQILSIAQLNHKTTAIDFHPNENICAIANDKVIYIISLTDKSILQTIFTYNGTVNILHFVPNRPYLLSGTSEGRVMLYRYDAHSGISRLVSFPCIKEKRNITNNYVSTFACSQNYIASSGYGGCVSLIHLNSHKQIKIFCDSKVRVNSLCFIDEEKLLFGNVEGILYLQSLKNKEKALSINMPFANIKTILHFPQSDFAIVSGQSNSISLINIKTAKILRQRYITFEEQIHTMALVDEQNLIVVLKNNYIYHVKFTTIEDLQECIEHKNLKKAFEIIDTDPKLQGTKEHQRVELLYKRLYTNAFLSLIYSHKKEINSITEIIKNIKSKTDDIPLLYQTFNQYTKFKSLYLEKKYALAYNLSDKFPLLKETPQYKEMENIFKERYTLAQKQILLGRQDAAKDILTPYMTVLSKRTLIHLLLKQNKEFLEFLKALQRKDYKVIHTLVSKYELFKDISGYLALQKSEEFLLNNIQNTINNAQIDKAIQQIKSFQNLTCDENRLKELYDNALSARNLLKKYEENDFKTCYALIDDDTRLQKLEIAQILEKHWQKLMIECENYALQGDIQSIKKTLNELLGVETRTQRVGDLLRLSFQTKIKQLIQANSFTSAENIIYSYIDIFGTDKEIQALMKNYETYSFKKLAITYEQEKQQTRDSWLKSHIIMNP